MKTLPFDPADYLDTPEAQEELLADAVESGDAKYLAVALGTIARARGMSKVSIVPLAKRETRGCRPCSASSRRSA
jgi:probable addiction module antidote protein